MIKGMTKKPFGGELMFDAFIGCVIWAAQEPEIVKRFQSDTGTNLGAFFSRSPIEKMVDKATGFQRDIFIKWCDWVTVHIWGEE